MVKKYKIFKEKELVNPTFEVEKDARLSSGRQKEEAIFPDMRGFSPRNLKYMRAFAAAWPEKSIVQGDLAQLTWYHNLALPKALESSLPTVEEIEAELGMETKDKK